MAYTEMQIHYTLEIYIAANLLIFLISSTFMLVSAITNTKLMRLDVSKNVDM